MKKKVKVKSRSEYDFHGFYPFRLYLSYLTPLAAQSSLVGPSPLVSYQGLVCIQRPNIAEGLRRVC
jgi:hypothetical protein